jgi:phosphatidylglycerophosphate synthase
LLSSSEERTCRASRVGQAVVARPRDICAFTLLVKTTDLSYPLVVTQGGDRSGPSADFNPGMSNLLTGLRLFVSVPTAWAIATGRPGTALLCFAVAALSDALDGPVARWRGEASLTGLFFDHGSDAVFVATGFAALALSGAGTLWLALLIAGAFLEYAWDYLTVGAQLRGNALGRWNGVAYYVLLGTWLAVNASPVLQFPGSAVLLSWLAQLLSVLSLGSLFLGLRSRFLASP